MEIEAVIGAQVQAERKRQGLSLAALGTEVGRYLGRPWTPQGVWQAEQGQRDFKAAHLLAFALALGVPVVQILAPELHRQPEVKVGDHLLTEDELDQLFPAAGKPSDATALLDLEQEVLSVEEWLRVQSEMLREQMVVHSFRLTAVRDRLMGLVAKADKPSRVKKRYRQVRDLDQRRREREELRAKISDAPEPEGN